VLGGLGNRIGKFGGWAQRRAKRFAALERKVAALERLAQGSRATYVGNNRVLVGAVVGTHNIAYYVDADDRLISPWFITTGAYETSLTNFFLRELKIDSHCLDIGSNFGYFACLFARLALEGRVLAVEADQRVYALCRDNLSINGFHERARAIHAAASNSIEPLTLYRRVGRPGNTSIVNIDTSFTDYMAEPPVEPFEVASVRVDDLAEEFGGRVDFLKIDVEGAEPLVLSGAERVIEQNPDLNLVMEWSPGQIRAAGFDVGDFLSHIDALKLRPSVIMEDSVEATDRDALLGASYHTGILLRR